MYRQHPVASTMATFNVFVLPSAVKPQSGVICVDIMNRLLRTLSFNLCVNNLLSKASGVLNTACTPCVPNIPDIRFRVGRLTNS